MCSLGDFISFHTDETDYKIKSDEQRLAEIEELIDLVMKTGHAYAADGAIEYTQSDLTRLEELRSKYENRVLLFRGVTGKKSSSR